VRARGGLVGTIIQISLLDIVFSLDSVITAVGMAQHLPVMILAVTVALFVMLLAAGAISHIVHRHPTIKMLALAFLIMIGVMLVADGVGQHIDRGYIYFAMAFSAAVEMLNLRVRRQR
jgi:predicted tellurium resistance membrane protein TerC